MDFYSYRSKDLYILSVFAYLKGLGAMSALYYLLFAIDVTSSY